MEDNHLDRTCFGIIWDGTGLGTDGTIWGGEFLEGDLEHFTRKGTVRPVRLPGGDRAVREIGRIALSLVRDAGLSDYSRVPLPDEKCALLAGLSDSPLSPAASSIGRLFDGVCALILGRAAADYEGEGAALVEALSPRGNAGCNRRFSGRTVLSAFLLPKRRSTSLRHPAGDPRDSGRP